MRKFKAVVRGTLKFHRELTVYAQNPREARETASDIVSEGGEGDDVVTIKFVTISEILVSPDLEYPIDSLE
jgi:hypothetical protein